MSKVNGYRDDDVETLYDRLLPLMQADEPDVYGRKVRAQEAIRAALEAVSSIHEAEPVAWVNAGQLAAHEDGEGHGGSYLPVRKTRAKNFTKPLFARRFPESLLAFHDIVGNGDGTEAVAWMRMNYQGTQSTGVTDVKVFADQWAKEGDTIIPLYAHPAPISKGVTVKVKALEWEQGEGNYDGQEVWSAGDPWLFWIVKNPDSPNYVWCETLNLEGFVPASPVRGSYPTLAEAKAAAQADFDARILSCLSHTAGEIEAGGEVEIEPVQEMHELEAITEPDGMDPGGLLIEHALTDDRMMSINSHKSFRYEETFGMSGAWLRTWRALQAADKRIAELTGALKPFAKCADMLAFSGATDASEIELSGDDLLDALNTARAALEPRP